VDADPADVVTVQRNLSGVNSGSHRDAEAADFVKDRVSGCYRLGRCIEDRKVSITRRRDASATETLHLSFTGPIRGFEYVELRFVPHLGCTLGRPDDVGEKHRRQTPP
jgi:hypothetical protein